MPDFKHYTYKYSESIASSLLILLFLYAAISKLSDITLFEHQLSLQPFPNWMSQLFIWLIPSVELLVVFLLFFEFTRKFGFITSTLLLILFTIYIGLILLKFWDHIPCACGGMISWLGWKAHFWFNLFFLTLSIIGIYSSKERRSAFP